MTSPHSDHGNRESSPQPPTEAHGRGRPGSAFLATTTGKVTAIAAVAVILTGIGVGVALSLGGSGTETETAASPRPTTGVINLPSATVTPTPTPEPEAVPAALVKYAEMPVEEFAELERREQVLYVSWLYRNLDAFVAEYLDQRKTTTDIYTPATPTLNPQQALANTGWMDRYALSLPEPDALKSLYLLEWFGEESSDWSDLTSRVSPDGGNARFLAEGLVWPIGIVTNLDTVEAGYFIGDFPAWRDVQLTYDGVEQGYFPGGTIFRGNLYYDEAPGYDGELFAFWGTY